MTVKQVQLLLLYLGYNPGVADGVAGAKTRAAVKAFQAAEGLSQDGVAGEKTQAALLDAVAGGRFAEKSPDNGKTGTFWEEIRYFRKTDPYIGCSCGKCGGFPVEPSEVLMRLADKVRAKAGKPMVPTSTVRCPAHNAAVGGVANSRHLKGTAMDFVIPGMSAAQVLSILREFPEVVYSYAINDRAVHMDVG